MSNDLVTTTGNDSAAYADAMPAYGFETQRNVAARDLSKSEIERIRDTDIDRYFSEGLDRRLLQFIKEELGQTQATDPMPVEDSRTALCETPAGARLVANLERMGGFKMQITRLQSDVGGLVRSLGDDRRQRAFMERFDRSLPEDTRYAIYGALAMGAPSFVTPVAAEKVREFSASSAGAALVAEWGSDAPTRIATIWTRMERLKPAIGPDGMADFEDWFGDLSDVEKKHILRFLSAAR